MLFLLLSFLVWTTRFLHISALPPLASSGLCFLQEKEARVEKFLLNARDTFLTIAKLRDQRIKLTEQALFWKSNEHLLSALEYDNRELRRILGFKRIAPMTLVAAHVIGRSAENWFNYLTLDRGSADGIRVQMPVVNEQGLVGRIVETGPYYSKVLALTAPQSRVNVLDRETGDEGVIAGRLHHALAMNYVENTATITSGDMVLTSGTSTIFPSGIPVGIVKKVQKDKYQIFQ